MDETTTALSASGILLERHRGGVAADAFAQRLGMGATEYLALLVEGLPPALIERIGFRLGLSFEQEQELGLAADIDRAPARLRHHLARLRERAELAERELMRVCGLDPAVRRGRRVAAPGRPGHGAILPLGDAPMRALGTLDDFLAVSVARDSVRLVAIRPMRCDREPERDSHVLLLGPGESCWMPRRRYRLVLVERGVALLRLQDEAEEPPRDEFMVITAYGPSDPAPTV